jgi:hypothetical protein
MLLAFALLISLPLAPVPSLPLGTFPGMSDTERSRDKLLLALGYRAAGDEKKMLLLLKELAEAQVVNTGMGGWMDGADGVGPGTRSYARVTLAEYHFAKKEWADALKWYEGWEPFVQGCGLSSMAAKRHRADRIAACHKELGLKP